MTDIKDNSIDKTNKATDKSYDFSNLEHELELELENSLQRINNQSRAAQKPRDPFVSIAAEQNAQNTQDALAKQQLANHNAAPDFIDLLTQPSPQPNYQPSEPKTTRKTAPPNVETSSFYDEYLEPTENVIDPPVAPTANSAATQQAAQEAHEAHLDSLQKALDKNESRQEKIARQKREAVFGQNLNDIYADANHRSASSLRPEIPVGAQARYFERTPRKWYKLSFLAKINIAILIVAGLAALYYIHNYHPYAPAIIYADKTPYKTRARIENLAPPPQVNTANLLQPPELPTSNITSPASPAAPISTPPQAKPLAQPTRAERATQLTHSDQPASPAHIANPARPAHIARPASADSPAPAPVSAPATVHIPAPAPAPIPAHAPVPASAPITKPKPKHIPAPVHMPTPAPAPDPVAVKPAVKPVAKPERAAAPIPVHMPSRDTALKEKAAQHNLPTAKTHSYTGYYVQLASSPSEQSAETMRTQQLARYAEALKPYNLKIERSHVPSRGVYYRLRVNVKDIAEARKLCYSLREHGGQCIFGLR